MNGQASIVERLEPEQVETVKANPKIAINQVVSVENKYLWFRCSKPPFNDVRVRMAACHSIDRAMIVELLGAAGHASANYVSPVKFGYVDLENYPAYDPAKAAGAAGRGRLPEGEGAAAARIHHVGGFLPEDQGIRRGHHRDAQRAGVPGEPHRPGTGGMERAPLPSPRRRPGPHGRLRLVHGLAGAGSGAAHPFPLVLAPDHRHRGRRDRREPRQGAGSAHAGSTQGDPSGRRPCRSSRRKCRLCRCSPP